MNLVGEDDEALFGTVPHGLVVVAERVPREDAMLVGQQQTVDAEVAAYSQAPFVAFSQSGVWEPEFVVKLENRHLLNE